MLDAEAGLARALERAGLAPAGSGEAVTATAKAANFDAERARRARGADRQPGARRWPGPWPGGCRRPRSAPCTAGATSQDILDTAAMLLAKRAIDVMLADLAQAADAAAGLAEAHRATIMIGRTLLQQAVPVTFGLVAAGWLTSLDEAREGLAAVALGAAGRAVRRRGGHARLARRRAGPQVAALLAEELGLALPVLPWHTDRLRIIDLGAALARVTAALGKIARDVTLLAQSEIGEVSEGSLLGRARRGPSAARRARAAAASPRRGGSSAMPHKRNPVASIAILGCTRQVPGLLGHPRRRGEQELQRAAGAWHAEWEPLTALLRLTGSASSWAAELLPGLTVDASRMAANLAATKGLPLAEHVTSLLAGVLGGAQAHDLVAEAGAAGGQRGAAAARRAAVRAQAGGPAGLGRHHRRSRSIPRSSLPLPRRRGCLHQPRRSTPTQSAVRGPARRA